MTGDVLVQPRLLPSLAALTDPATLSQLRSDRLWSRLEAVAVVSGARMLLWSKTLALELERPGAADEWNWWVNRLLAMRPESTAV